MPSPAIACVEKHHGHIPVGKLTLRPLSGSGKSSRSCATTPTRRRARWCPDAAASSADRIGHHKSVLPGAHQRLRGRRHSKWLRDSGELHELRFRAYGAVPTPYAGAQSGGRGHHDLRDGQEPAGSACPPECAHGVSRRRHRRRRHQQSCGRLRYLMSLGHRRIGFISGPWALKSARIRRTAFLRSLSAHRRIGFISGPWALKSARIRRTAFLRSLSAYGIDEDKRLVEEGDHTVDGGLIAMTRMLESKCSPTALLASNDLTAIGAMRAVRRAGLSVPGDISIVGFDDIRL